MIYRDKLDEIVTQEAFYNELIIKNDRLIIPYINLGLSDHPLNESSVLKYLNYCYIICNDVVMVKKNNDVFYENNGLNFDEYRFFYFTGVNLKNLDKGMHEFTVLCKSAFLQILNNTMLKNQFWRPIDSEFEKANMKSEELNLFFKGDLMPSDLKRLIEN